MSFNWRTEEERGWDQEIRTPSGAPGRSTRRRWGQLALLIVALSLASIAAWRGLQTRAERNREALEQGLRSSHALALRAAEQGDAELLTAVLSGRDSRWTASRLRLLDSELLFARAATPLGLEASDTPGAIVDVTFAPDLKEAMVTSRYTYTVAAAPADERTVSLRQTLVYRQGADRWLLSPPDEPYWGPWQTQAGEHVRLTFRQRDAEVAAQILSVLDDAASALCLALARSCPQDDPFEVLLDVDGETLRRLYDDRFPTFRFGELALPSPSLVGRGVDAASNQALYEGYAVYLQVAVAQELLEFDCCQGAQFMDTLAAMQAHELGYGAGPLHDADMLQMVETLPSLRQFSRLWWGAYRTPFTTQDRAQVAAFVDYLREQSGASLAELQVALSGAFGFWDWIQPFVAHDVVDGRAALEASWRDFILAKANNSLRATDALPSQSLQLICEDQSGQRALYGYEPPEQRWTYERALSGRAPALLGTPGDEGVVLFDRVSGDPARLPARLLLDGKELPLPGDLAPAYSLPADPQGRFMPMWRIAQSGRTVDGVVLLDLERCMDDDGCDERSLDGLPSWSPSGEQLLIWDPESGSVSWHSRDLRGVSPGLLSSSTLPFWMDEHSAGLVSADGGAIQVVALRENGQWMPHELLSLEPVLGALERNGDGRNWRFAQVYRVPGEERVIVGALTLPESGARHYFVASFDSLGQATRIVPLQYVPQLVVTSPESLISADGAWLSLHLFPEALLAARFMLFHLPTGNLALESLSPYFTAHRAHDWSADGRWLARILINYIELATGSGEEMEPLRRQFVSTGQLQCSSVAWVNR